MAKVTVLLLAVDRLAGVGLSKPRLIASYVVETADNILGARDTIPVAFADLKEHEYLVISRVSVATERGWVEKSATLGSKKSEEGPEGAARPRETRLLGSTWTRTGAPAKANRSERPVNPFEE